jgi:thiamine pyrophosphate-dependent acetolactate synthase large subunit-like protein
MGVPGVRVETAEALCQELERALKEPGPKLIEMMII